MQIFRYKKQKICAFGADSSFWVHYYVHFAFFLLQPRSFCSPGKVIGTWSRDDLVLNGTFYVNHPIHITQKKMRIDMPKQKKIKAFPEKVQIYLHMSKKSRTFAG